MKDTASLRIALDGFGACPDGDVAALLVAILARVGQGQARAREHYNR